MMKTNFLTLKLNTMKTKFFVLLGALLVVAGIAAFLAHKPMTAREELILKNVAALALGEDNSGDYMGYQNQGHYVVTRAGEGSGSLSPDEWAKFEITSDVILVTYYNDCEPKRKKECYENLRTIPPVIIYQQH